MATVTKRDLVSKTAEKLGLEYTGVKRVVEDFISNIKEQISKGNRIEIRDFGVFEIKIRKPRIGRNPKKPENVVTIPERKIVHFKAGREFKRMVG